MLPQLLFLGVVVHGDQHSVSTYPSVSAPTTNATSVDLMARLEPHFIPGLAGREKDLYYSMRNVAPPGCVVKFQLKLYKVSNVDTGNAQIDIAAWLRLSWNDPRITWTPSNYDGTNYMNVPATELPRDYGLIWTPEIELQNNLESIGQSFPANKGANVESNGDVQWSRSGNIRALCTFEGMELFPFDQPKCHLIFSAWSMDSSKMGLDFADAGGLEWEQTEERSSIHYQGYQDLAIEKVELKRIEVTVNGKTYPELHYSLTLKRASQFYVLRYIMPQLFFAFAVFLVFLFEPDYNRLNICILFLLVLMSFDQITSEFVPKSEAPILLSYLTMYTVMFTVFAFVESAVVQWLWTRDSFEDMFSFRGIVDLLKSPLEEVRDLMQGKVKHARSYNALRNEVHTRGLESTGSLTPEALLSRKASALASYASSIAGRNPKAAQAVVTTKLDALAEQERKQQEEEAAKKAAKSRETEIAVAELDRVKVEEGGTVAEDAAAAELLRQNTLANSAAAGSQEGAQTAAQPQTAGLEIAPPAADADVALTAPSGAGAAATGEQVADAVPAVPSSPSRPSANKATDSAMKAYEEAKALARASPTAGARPNMMRASEQEGSPTAQSPAEKLRQLRASREGNHKADDLVSECGSATTDLSSEPSLEEILSVICADEDEQERLYQLLAASRRERRPLRDHEERYDLEEFNMSDSGRTRGSTRPLELPEAEAEREGGLGGIAEGAHAMPMGSHAMKSPATSAWSNVAAKVGSGSGSPTGSSGSAARKTDAGGAIRRAADAAKMTQRLRRTFTLFATQTGPDLTTPDLMSSDLDQNEDIGQYYRRCARYRPMFDELDHDLTASLGRFEVTIFAHVVEAHFPLWTSASVFEHFFPNSSVREVSFHVFCVFCDKHMGMYNLSQEAVQGYVDDMVPQIQKELQYKHKTLRNMAKRIDNFCLVVTPILYGVRVWQLFENFFDEYGDKSSTNHRYVSHF
eukprot:g5563.t1